MADREGQSETLTRVEEDAYALSQAALLLDQARQNREAPEALKAALNHNAEVWIAIRAMVKRANGSLPDAVKSNLLKLGEFVITTTIHRSEGVQEHTLDTLININLQIAEGLLEAQANDASRS